jgi:hypothetical protein
MKPFRIISLLLVLATCAQANVYVPRAKLTGETVSVRILNGSAAVTAIFEFEYLITRDEKVIYFPIFSTDGDDPIHVLSQANFDLEINGQKFGTATACAAPRAFKKLPPGAKAFWFVVNLEAFVTIDVLNSGKPVIVRFTYSQPLIHREFFYLPVITGHDVLDREGRAWRYQMHARCPTKMVRVLSTDTDYEQLDDGITVFLKDGELVELE